MSDETNNPNLEPWIDAALEARVVAWVLGDASEFEAAELARIVEEKPELAVFKRRIEAVHGLVAEAVRPGGEPLRLSPERRQKVLDVIGSAAVAGGGPAVFPGRPSKRSRLSRWVLPLAACVVLGFAAVGLMMPVYNSVQMKASRLSSMTLEHDRLLQEPQLAESLERAPAGPLPMARPALTPEAAMPDAPVAQTAAAVPQSQTERLLDEAKNLEGGGAALASLGRVDSAKEQHAADAYRETRSRFAYDVSGPAGGKGEAAAQSQLGLDVADKPRSGEIWDSDRSTVRNGSIPRESDADVTSDRGRVAGTEWSENEDGVALYSDSEGRDASAFGGFINYGSPINAPSTPGQRDVALRGNVSVPDRQPVIPDLDFRETPVADAVATLEKKAREAGQDVRFDAPASDSKVTMNLKDVPVDEAVRYFAGVTGSKVMRKGDSFTIVPQSEPTDVLVTKEYRVPQGFISAGGDAKGFLEGNGMTFPQGAQATYLADGSRLVVRNTPENLDLIDTLVSAAKPPPEPTAGEVAASDEPFSTFSLHVSDVSFRLAQAALAKGQMPERERVRAEEFYNAFDYGDPAPAGGEEVACRIEQSAHPFLQQRNLVRIAMKVASTGRGAGQPLRLTVLLDTSGSMEREDRVASVRRAMEALATLLGPQDSVTLIGFARQPRLLADRLPGDQASKLAEIASQTPSEGGTNLEEALKLASERALQQRDPAAQNRIVLLTDGAANLGEANSARLALIIERLRQQGIAFDACGVGAEGLNDELLEALTREGDGRYYFLNGPEDAGAGFAGQLAGAFRPAAENVKVQVQFNPARVARYRLIGFEKHRLKKEDFRNDKVDAAELAAEEAAVAIYQIEALPEGEGELGAVFVRFRDPSNGRMVERSWPMAYEPNARAFDQASPSMQLAGTAAMLAEVLSGGPVSQLVDFERLAPVVNGLRSHYANEPRVRELVTMFEQIRKMTHTP